MAINIKERLREISSNNLDSVILIMWESEDIANYYRENITPEYLDFVRECSKNRKIEVYNKQSLPPNFVILTAQPTIPICIGATVEALKNDDMFFDTISDFGEKYNFSYIQII